MNDSHPADILIVDDEPNNLSILRQLLSAQGYKVRPMLSGELALQAVNSLVPDLILMDIMMPEGMDGFETCARLKAIDRIKDVPVIFLSALYDTADKVRAFDAGGVDYITKPFEQAEVLTRIKTHLDLHCTREILQEKNKRLEETVLALENALKEIKTLQGILPICCHCKKIRDDKGYWNRIDQYISEHTGVNFSHGLCPDCAQELYPDFHKKKTGLDKSKEN